jgi:hypothetical protein
MRSAKKYSFFSQGFAPEQSQKVWEIRLFQSSGISRLHPAEWELHPDEQS